MFDLLWYQGGKSYLADFLIETFPKHKCYVEVFGGGASVLLKKNRSTIEVYNDLYGDVVVFFRVLRDKPELLKEYLTKLPYSREEHDLLQKRLLEKEITDDIERASAFFFISNSSFSGEISSSFSTSKIRNHSVRFCEKVDALKLFSNRLRGVVIEKLDFRKCIEKYDGTETLFYLDPPYLGRKNEYYRINFDYRDHHDLAKILNEVEGKVVLSHSESEEIRELYKKPKWSILEKIVPIRTSYVKGLKTKPTMKELVFINFQKEQKSKRKSLAGAFG